MKPEYTPTSRYADLLTDPSDEPLHQLMQELDTAYSAPKRPEGLTWKPGVRQLALLDPHAPGDDSGIVHVRPKYRRAPALLAFVAVISMVLLSAIVFSTMHVSWSQQNLHTQTPPSLYATDALLLQQLWHSDTVPTNVRGLAQDGQFTKINLPDGNVTIQQAYADANNIIIAYTLDISPYCGLENVNSNVISCNLSQALKGFKPTLQVRTDDGQTYRLTPSRYLLTPIKDKRLAVLVYYDASSIQGKPAWLHLTVLPEQGASSQTEFTIPFHADKTVIDVNQTVSSHGDTLTLKRVIITPTDVRFENQGLSPKQEMDLFPSFGSLSIAGKSYQSKPLPSGSFLVIYDDSQPLVEFDGSLHRFTGTWTVTETGMRSHTWTFVFNV